MLTERQLVYFDPFYFENGAPAKAKYFIVLRVIKSSKVVLASLPSSKDYIPSIISRNKGCVESKERNINCYCFPPDEDFTECGFQFNFPTFLYGAQLNDHSISHLKDVYPLKGIDYEIIGKIKRKIFDDILNCFKKSSTVKRKYKKVL